MCKVMLCMKVRFEQCFDTSALHNFGSWLLPSCCIIHWPTSDLIELTGSNVVARVGMIGTCTMVFIARELQSQSFDGALFRTLLR